MTETQVHLYLLNEELGRPVPIRNLLKRFNIASNNTFASIKKGISYKDFSIRYKRLTKEQKEQLASLLREQ